MFNIISNIYTKRNSKWIDEIDNNIAPVLILKWLSMNDKIITHVNYLNKYVYWLEPKHFLSLAWAIIPKYSKAPFIKYMKKQEEENLYEELFIKIRKVLEMSDNDFKYCHPYLLKEIENNKKKWFNKFGMDKKFWATHGMDSKQEMKSEKREGKGGLELFGL